MPCPQQFEIIEADLPFRRGFRHAAAVRTKSGSLFLKCTLDTGETGFGESLLRDYVTGESRDEATEVLGSTILPRLIGRPFDSLEAVWDFLTECDGLPPKEWTAAQASAAWCAVDLSLLDAMGRACGRAVSDMLPAVGPSEEPRYAAVLSSSRWWQAAPKLLKIRLFGFDDVKVKVGSDGDEAVLRLARLILGRHTALRVDANMAWSEDEAVRKLRVLHECGVTVCEQPLPADDLDALARLSRESPITIALDESVTTARSLQQAIERKAAGAVNIRISKCGGLVASSRRCKEVLDAGLRLIVGCQVGESSLLSTAQLVLLAALRDVAFAEGCYGLHLLREDPVSPLRQFGRGGRRPAVPAGPGLGVRVDEAMLREHAGRCRVVQ